jgi:hypothetical protein
VPEGGRGKLFKSTDIAECGRIEPALMRAKPRCGHGVAFSMKREDQVAHLSRWRQQQSAESPIPPSEAGHPRRLLSTGLYRIGRGIGIVPANVPTLVTRGSIARIRARQLGPDRSAPNRFNDLRAVQVGMVAALLTAGNAK